MARFQAKPASSIYYKPMLSLLLFLFLLLLFLAGIENLSGTAVTRQKQQLENALSRAVTYSYATNGYYPETLEDLVKEYKINYNQDLFYVDYQVLGGNLFPEITILSKKGDF